MTCYVTRDRAAVLAALAAPLAAAAVLLPFRATWPNTNVALLLVVVVVGVSATGSRAPGALAAVSAAAWFDFFFTLPFYRFTIRGPAGVTTAVLLLLTGVAVSVHAEPSARRPAVAAGAPGRGHPRRSGGPRARQPGGPGRDLTSQPRQPAATD